MFDKSNGASDKVVFDLGSGTGLLAAYCVLAGFKNIVACEKSQVCFGRRSLSRMV